MLTFFEEGEAPGSVPPGAPGVKKLGIPTGTTVAARLVVTLSSDAPNTPATAELPEGLTFPDTGRVLPPGTRVIGRASYKVNGAQGLVEVTFSRLVLPDRSEVTVSAIAVMLDGKAGLVGRLTKKDDRNGSNIGEGLLDIADAALGTAPGKDAAGRFTDDERSDVRDLRKQALSIQVAKNLKFKVQFTQPL
jgi:type IV secretory pathway VirB10-like protein